MPADPTLSERLRAIADTDPFNGVRTRILLREAADEIERLRSALRRANTDREALDAANAAAEARIARGLALADDLDRTRPPGKGPRAFLVVSIATAIREALTGPGEGKS